nr:extracellular solute-binding protein [uncultured Sphaerochaeta sp.]
MKRTTLITLLLITAVAFGLYAGGAAESSAQPTTTLELWHIQVNETAKKPIEDAVRRFEVENPGVKVNISVIEANPYKTKLKTVTGEDFPDVFHSWGGSWLQSFVDAGMVADITEASKEWSDQVSESAFALNVFDGKVYGSPYMNSSTIMYYNKALFKKYNLTPPKTFSELEQVCETFKNNGIIPFALANQAKWPGAQHFVLLSMRLGGPDIFKRAIDGEVKFTDDVFVKAGNMLVDMVDKGYFPEGVNGIDYNTGGSRVMFYAEQAAMIVQTSNMLSIVKSENPAFYQDKLGVMLYPSIERGKGKATDLLAGENAFSVSAYAEDKKLAAKLVGYLSTDIQLMEEYAKGGAIGASKFTPVPDDDPLLQDAMGQIANATFIQNFIDQTLAPELSNTHKDTVQALYGGTMTSVEAAKTMQKIADGLK